MLNFKTLLNHFLQINTKGTKGGVAIFIKNNHEAYEREDLKISNEEFESVWVELKNTKSNNIVIGCTYRHPHYNNIDDYTPYMRNNFNKLNKENKEVYIAGDFNIDLLKYDTNIKYKDFYNFMTASGFLPQITQPTRITETTMTIIDNIYTNTFTDNIYSGNLLLEIADHLAQFVCTDNKNISKTNDDMYKRDYTNWNEQSFLDDLSVQNWKKICKMSVKNIMLSFGIWNHV